MATPLASDLGSVMPIRRAFLVLVSGRVGRNRPGQSGGVREAKAALEAGLWRA